MKLLKRLMIILVLFNSLTYASNIDDYDILTEIFPPYNFQDNGQLKGISVEIFEQMLRQLKSQKKVTDIKVYPWARAYDQVSHKPNTLLFSMFKTPFREEQFKWVGPIDTSLIGLIAKKDRKINIDSFEDLKDYRIGTVSNDIAEQLLIEKGFDKKNLDSLSGTNSIDMSIQKLNKNRIDLFAYITTFHYWDIKDKTFDANDYETVYVLDVKELFFAFHKSTDEALIKQMQNVLDKLKKDGIHQQILEKYKY